MREDIKNRIEKISRGEVPDGYKKSKVRIIPENWELYKLSDLLKFKNGINGDKELFGSGTKLINVLDILSEKTITYDSIKGSVQVSTKQINDYSVSYGDVLFQRSSENYEDAGTANVYIDKEKKAVFSGFVIRGKKINDYNPLFLNYLLKDFKIRKSIIRSAAGVQHVNIGQESLEKINIYLPEEVEQQKIAEILSTQDKIIELKQNLIEQKKLQKKYLMENLLTGKTRLKGFLGEWKTLKLGDIAPLRGGYSFESNLFKKEGIPVIKISNILPNGTIGGFFSYYEELQNDKDYLLPDKSILIAMSGATTGKVSILNNRNNEKIYQNQRVGYFNKTNKADYSFISFLVKSDLFNQLLTKELAIGAQPNISAKSVDNFQFLLPPLPEQQAIAQILSTADKEIELLQQELEQEKLKKKSLSQLLLTGIVRV